MGLFEGAPGSVTGGTVRKTMAWIGGRGWVDPVPGADEMRNDERRVGTTSATTTTSFLSGNVSGSGSEEGSGLGSESGSVVLGGSMGSSLGEDIGEGVRVLDEELVKSPGGI
jgi:hypothetical protein